MKCAWNERALAARAPLAAQTARAERAEDEFDALIRAADRAEAERDALAGAVERVREELLHGREHYRGTALLMFIERLLAILDAAPAEAGGGAGGRDD